MPKKPGRITPKAVKKSALKKVAKRRVTGGKTGAGAGDGAGSTTTSEARQKRRRAERNKGKHRRRKKQNCFDKLKKRFFSDSGELIMNRRATEVTTELMSKCSAVHVFLVCGGRTARHTLMKPLSHRTVSKKELKNLKMLYDMLDLEYETAGCAVGCTVTDPSNNLRAVVLVNHATKLQQ